ncbi:TonB family protein [Flavihumibacter rivuli]|uniref:energy transducer TonB n=1 Tax=Flavihumibacter rivuli TaxID=2838156 RepID=UPI001BDF3408|nr:energy transducer TonB [Flavihumibacter rivuli]ULQ56487.1 TonB family protein [Flavihumibacter rivuli]
MKHTICLFILGSLLSFCTMGQSSKGKDFFYLLDKNENGTSEVKDAKYFLHLWSEGDSLWHYCYYNLFGPRIRYESFKDKDATIAHGEFYYYNSKGMIDSIASFKDNLAHGDWWKVNDTGKLVRTVRYDKGKAVPLKDTISAKTLPDSIAQKLALSEKESEFPGGLSGWAAYLNKNMKYPERAVSSEIQGTVIVQFIVDKEGNVLDPMIYQSVEWSIDQEALRIIKQSPKWVPAMQDGRKVKSYKRQPITFRLME